MAMRVGILGLGSIGLRHAKNVLWLQEHEVFGFDPSEERQTLLTSYGGRPCTRDGVLACDAIIVASPTIEHYQDLRDCQKPTLAEKPIADRLIDFDTSHIRLVGYNLRYHSCVRQAKQWIENGAIGKVLHADFILAQFNERPAYLRDGVAFNWSHEIDLALHLLGEAETLAAVHKNNTVADFFLHHKSGAVSSVHLNYVNKREQRYFNIVGSKGRIFCVLSPYRTADCYPDDDQSIISYSYDTTFDQDYVTEIKAFLSGNIGPGCTAEQGMAVLKVLGL